MTPLVDRAHLQDVSLHTVSGIYISCCETNENDCPCICHDSSPAPTRNEDEPMTDLDTPERDTDVFTSGEKAAVSDFEAAVHVSGLHDCFSAFDVGHIRWHEGEFGRDATRTMLREHAQMLNTWYLALDRLLGDILTCTSDVTRYSGAARRYVADAADLYHRTRQDFEYAATVWSLTLSTEGLEASYPPPTRSVNYPMQTLTDEGS